MQGIHSGQQEEAEVTPGEQQVPPKADDGRPLDTPVPIAAAARYIGFDCRPATLAHLLPSSNDSAHICFYWFVWSIC